MIEKSDALRITLAMLGFLILSRGLQADTLWLKNGNFIEGVVTDNVKNNVVVETEIGKITLSRDEIEELNIVNEDENQKMYDMWQEERELRKKEKVPKKETQISGIVAADQAISIPKKEIIKTNETLTQDRK
ncbi:MAG: hypothetical protein L6416_09330 [Candidatus Omnitrophica bacterium]|nr:hypothetical protein [Candidatus Omnitrophota bacterium]